MGKKAKSIESEIQVLRAFIESRFQELKSELKKVLVHARGATVAKRPVAKVAAKVARPVGGGDALENALKSHKRSKELVKAGKQRDQLLRSLIPLYLAKGLAGVEVNSGAISAFWKKQGVSYAGPNAAKALRSHVGYADKSGSGWVITPNGAKYVEAALAGGAKKLAA